MRREGNTNLDTHPRKPSALALLSLWDTEVRFLESPTIGREEADPESPKSTQDDGRER